MSKVEFQSLIILGIMEMDQVMIVAKQITNQLSRPPLPPPPPVFSRSFSMDDDHRVTEVYLISHGECEWEVWFSS